MSKGQRKYDGEEKVAIIERMHKEGLGIKETAGIYGVAHQRICDWEHIYIAEGADMLRQERRGRKSTGRPVKLSKQVERDLLTENQKLRMEIDYLKKLNALVSKEEPQNRKHE